MTKPLLKNTPNLYLASFWGQRNMTPASHHAPNGTLTHDEPALPTFWGSGNSSPAQPCHSLTWVGHGQEGKSDLFLKDCVGLKDRRAWLLVLVSETGELLSKRVNLIFSPMMGQAHPSGPVPTHRGNPACFFLRTGDITTQEDKKEQELPL